MRKIATFEDAQEARLVYNRLVDLNIDCQFDQNEGQYEIWVKGEDQVPYAAQVVKEFREKGVEGFVQQTLQDAQQQENKNTLIDSEEKLVKSKRFFYGPITRLLLVVCTILFIVSTIQMNRAVEAKTVQAFFPALTPLNQALMYDDPPAIRIMHELAMLEDLQQQKKNGAQVQENEFARIQQLKQELAEDPLWVGFYQLLLHSTQKGEILKASFFTSIRKGEVWRVFTPTLLHAGVLHVLFNMLWLWVLGRSVEANMGPTKFVIFVFIGSVVTNTLQYLMTGPFFMGISGVLAAFAGYVWIRKTNAPWEIYLIDRASLVFLGFFIFGLFGLQIIAFFLQLVHNTSILPLNFANTAHISGVFLGMGLGKTKFFQRIV